MKTQRFLKAALMAALCYGVSVVALADVPARIELDNGNVIDCKLRWMPASKRYVIIRQPAGGGPATEQQVEASKIVRKQVAPPAGWRELLQQAGGSNPNAAIPQLLRIIDQYNMLEYDEQAAYVIGTIYLKTGRAKEFLKIAEKVIQDNSAAAMVSKMAPVYWQALIETGSTAGGQLDKMLDGAVATAPRPIAALALIARGDQLKKAGQLRAALKDGYLRVALLYTQERDANAEALYKASLVFDELNQATYAERMRQTLLSRHRTSEFAEKLRGN